MFHADILLSAFAISVFLIIYYVAVGFFPVFFETVFGYSQGKANTLGNWFWAFDAGGLLIVGVISDRLRVRKPFMVFGAVCAVIFTTIFALKATHPQTSYTTFVILLSCIAVSLALAFAPWMASFTETVERRNPALIATGLATWGLIIRIVIAVSVFFVPKVVTTATTLVQQGPAVKAVLSSPAPVGQTTIGKVATAAARAPCGDRAVDGDHQGRRHTHCGRQAVPQHDGARGARAGQPRRPGQAHPAAAGGVGGAGQGRSAGGQGGRRFTQAMADVLPHRGRR